MEVLPVCQGLCLAVHLLHWPVRCGAVQLCDTVDSTYALFDHYSHSLVCCGL